MIDCRKDFPILSTEINGRPLVYLDSAATAQKPEVVIRTLDELHRACNANIHRGVHHLAEETTRRYEEARAQIARFIGATEPSEVIFTSGATASLNLAASCLPLQAGDNIVLSRMEHHSNIVPWQMAAARVGAEVRVIEIDQQGELLFAPTDIDERTKIVAIAQASNVLGTEPDLKPIVERAHAVGAVVVVDGCQGVVHGGVDVTKLGCDLYAFSGHKLYGPTGIGVLWGRRELLERIEPWQGGGDMIATVSLEKGSTWGEIPLKFEAGTPNFIGAIGLGAAVAYIEQFDPREVQAHEKGLYDRFAKGLEEIEGARIYGTAGRKSPICSFGVEGISPLDVAMIGDKLGVAMRSGRLCADPVMDFYGVRGLCRVSFGLYNTLEEVEVALGAISRAVQMLR